MTLLNADKSHIEAEPGEDTCELLAIIEDSFGIEFAEYEPILGRTVRELSTYISDRVQYSMLERCLSAVAFYRLRRAFSALFKTPRTSIRPTSDLRKLLPWHNRKACWRKLQDHLNLVLPALRYPTWLVCLSLALTITLTITILVVSRTTLGPISGVILLAGFLSLWFCILLLLTPFARELPKGCETFGGLVRVTLACNYATFASQCGSSESDVVLALRYLIAAEVGIEVTPDTRFPDDLNID
jgi:hypothetical protein